MRLALYDIIKNKPLAELTGDPKKMTVEQAIKITGSDIELSNAVLIALRQPPESERV